MDLLKNTLEKWKQRRAVYPVSLGSDGYLHKTKGTDGEPSVPFYLLPQNTLQDDGVTHVESDIAHCNIIDAITFNKNGHAGSVGDFRSIRT